MIPWEDFVAGVHMLYEPGTIVAILAGGVIGYLTGAIPGLNTANLTAILLPVLVTLPPVQAFLFVAAVYGVSAMGDAVPAVLFNVPGTPSAGATAIEGYALTRQGRTAEALSTAILAAVVAGMCGGVIAILGFGILGKLALAAGPPEMFAFALLGIASTAALASGGLWKGYAAALFGGLVGLAGTHQAFGDVRRGEFDILELYDGFPLLAVVLGAFGLSEALKRVTLSGDQAQDLKRSFEAQPPGLRASWAASRLALRTIRQNLRALGFGLVTGSVFGLLPGIGNAGGTYITYGLTSAIAKKPELIGKGSTEAIVATEAAQNSSPPTALVPTLTLGIPGSPVAAMMLAILLINGLRPGPAFYDTFRPSGIAIFLGGMVAYLVALVFGLLLVSYIARVARIPTGAFVAVIMVLSMVGVYSERRMAIDLVALLVFGIIGWLMAVANWPVAAFVIAYLLIELVDIEFYRSLRIGGAAELFNGPVVLVTYVLTALVLIVPTLVQRRARRRQIGPRTQSTRGDIAGRDPNSSGRERHDESGPGRSSRNRDGSLSRDR